jgi:hypothetical protein
MPENTGEKKEKGRFKKGNPAIQKVSLKGQGIKLLCWLKDSLKPMSKKFDVIWSIKRKGSFAF